MKIDQFIEKSIILSIGSCSESILKKLTTILKQEQCSFLESIILISLFFEPADSVIPSVLAERLGTTRGNISHCISKLEKMGLIKRQLDAKDARKYRLLLKPEGKRIALKSMKIIDDFENACEAAIGKSEVSKLLKNLKSLS